MSLKEKGNELRDLLIQSLKEGDDKNIKRYANKLSELSKEFSKKDPNYNPRFKKGDRVVYSLNYAKVIYKVANIFKSNSGIPLYTLVGEQVLEKYKENPYMSEYKKYQPFCQAIDNELTLLSETCFLN